ncbi:MAG: aspartate-semialdehyde dehydrogenase [Alphaproteobacteria bacterium]|nr:aspartate-semialdehyde dehydrogenase [Alphaproteobacteria bacterium]
MGYRVVVVGATGNVGQEILNLLAERKFPIDEIQAVASSTSRGQRVSFGEDKVLDVIPITEFDFKGVDFAFFAAGTLVSTEFALIAAEAGCIVIDNSSQFRQEAEVPLIVPEVNPEALAGYKGCDITLAGYKGCGIIANPNCVALPLAMALKPLMDEVGLKRLVVSTYQSVSGAGRAAMDELFNQTRAIYMNQSVVKEELPKQIAFNIIPQVDIFLPDGTTVEETKVANEVQKILGIKMGVAITCVRVPVFIGHSMAVALELDSPLSVGEARTLWREFPGISIVDSRQEDGYVTPAEVVGEDNVFISRIRKDKSVENGLLFWLVSDNLRKGAALNAVQIAEVLIKDYLNSNVN